MSITQAGTTELKNRGFLARLHKFYPAVDATAAGYCPYTAIWYVDAGNGSDVNSGLQPNEALKSLTKAVALATNFGHSHQCIILKETTTAYHDDTGETFPIVIAATLDHLHIMSRSPLPGTLRHTVIGATDEGGTSGLLYSLAENTHVSNLTFLSNKTPVYLGTETTHGTSTNVVTTGALVEGCVFDTGTTASQPALSLSCTNAVVENSELVANGTTSDALIAYDPFTIRDCKLQGVVDGIHIAAGATYTTRIERCVFEPKPGTTACTGYWVNIVAGSNDVVIYGCYCGPDSAGDVTASFGEDDGTFTGKISIIDNVGVTAVITPGAGAGDKTGTTTAIAIVVAY